MKLAELAQHIAAELVGDPDLDVTSVAGLEEAGPGQLSFLSNARYHAEFAATKATAVIVPTKIETGPAALLRCKDPYYAFAQAMVLLHGHRRHPHAGVHPSAHVDPTATVGENTVVYPGAFVGPRAKVGRDCVLYPHSAVYDDCVLGDRVSLHAGAVIGADGFGYATHGGVHHKIPQVGRVVVGDDVEVGANAVIARGAVGDTTVGAGTRIDALVMIGHGATLGRGCLIVAQTGIAGSVTIGNYVVMGGQSAATGHLSIGDQAILAARTAATNDVPAKAVVMGAPALPIARGRRAVVVFGQLPELSARVRKLERLAGVDTDPGAATPADDDAAPPE
jgi:UDP-3-O-[3-hydroxymyristoyl] glucosamine N-acyltransferase